MEFSRLGYWTGELFPSPGDLPNPRIEPRSPTLQAESLPAEPLSQHCFRSCCMHACYVTSVISDSVRPYGQQPTRLLCARDSLGKNAGVGCHFLLQSHDPSVISISFSVFGLTPSVFPVQCIPLLHWGVHSVGSLHFTTLYFLNVRTLKS